MGENLAAKIQALWWVSRPVSWVNTAYPFAAGYIMTQRSFDLFLCIATLFFLIPYNLLMYGINDVYDYESDIRNPRKGGVEGARTERSQHRTILLAAGLLPIPFLGWMISQQHDVRSLATLGVVLFLVIAYSAPKLRFKERPVLDSCTSSMHFVGPLLYAFSLTSYHPTQLYIVLAFLCWGIASHAFGAVQDIVADRIAGISSIATVFGARSTVRIVLVAYATAALLPLAIDLRLLPLTAVGAAYVYMVWPYRGIDDAHAERANQGWRRFLWLNFMAGTVLTWVLIVVYQGGL